MQPRGWTDVPDGERLRDGRRRAFEKEATLEIYLPLAGGLLLTLAMFLGVALPSRVSLASFSNLSVALLALPLLFSGLLGLALVILLLCGVAWLLRNLPPRADVLLGWVERGTGIIHRVADAAAAPVILVRATAELVLAPMRAFQRAFRSREEE